MYYVTGHQTYYTIVGKCSLLIFGDCQVTLPTKGDNHIKIEELFVLLICLARYGSNKEDNSPRSKGWGHICQYCVCEFRSGHTSAIMYPAHRITMT